MKKILVPTDFSAYSKSGVRFAISWADQQKLELVFVHVLTILRATRWSDSYFAKYVEQEEKLCKVKFEKFIAGIYKNMELKPGKHSFVIIQGISADIMILDYCRKTPGIAYICISTRGAGTFKKIFGTNTSNLISNADVPVLVVPKSYRTAPVNKILYATDFKNYAKELNHVIDFASPFKAKIEILHFTWPDEVIQDEKNMVIALEKRYKYGVKIHFKKNDAVHSLIENIQNQIRLKKPSVVIMFADQERTFFQKLFLGSKTAQLSFQTKVPLLVFNKESR